MFIQSSSKKKKVFLLSSLLVMFILVGAAGAVGAQGMDPEFMEIMDEVVHELEEIAHELEHVEEWLGIISYASIGIFLVLLAQTVILFRKK